MSPLLHIWLYIVKSSQRNEYIFIDPFPRNVLIKLVTPVPKINIIWLILISVYLYVCVWVSEGMTEWTTSAQVEDPKPNVELILFVSFSSFTISSKFIYSVIWNDGLTSRPFGWELDFSRFLRWPLVTVEKSKAKVKHLSVAHANVWLTGRSVGLFTKWHKIKMTRVSITNFPHERQ